MSQCPLESIALMELGWPWWTRRRQENRGVPRIGVTKKIPGPRIFYLEPTGRETGGRDYKFPAMLVISGDILLTVEFNMIVLDRKYKATENVRDRVVSTNSGEY